jgi:hypothetical protein
VELEDATPGDPGVPDATVPYASAALSEVSVGHAYDLDAHTTKKIATEIDAADPMKHGSRGSTDGVIDAFRPTAKTMLIELDYFDIDYRSEFSASHETSFAARHPETRRMHFFSQRIEDIHSLIDYIEHAKSSYLGYVILRPQFPGSIGRSLISPTGTSSPQTGDEATDTASNSTMPQIIGGTSLGRRIRTAVPEVVELFGITMRGYGVPYMEQDAHLLRCAHVSAWLCHYTAVLRGRVPRRVSSAFHFAEDETGSYGRQYPSHGLSTNVLSRILRKLDLPPEIIDSQAWITSANTRQLDWYHRSGLKRQVRNLPEDSVDRIRIWASDTVTSEICRYLNSGIPVILADDGEEHTQVICGYIRNGLPGAQYAVDSEMADPISGEPDPTSDSPAESQLGPEPDPLEAVGGVGTLILQDDGASPFSLLPAGDVIDRAIDSEGKLAARIALVVPLPRGLWLSGGVAEQHGAEILRSQIINRNDELTGWLVENQIDGQAADAYKALYRDVVEGLSVDADKYAIRSYVLSGSELKVSVRARINDPTVSRVLGYTRLPKFVWSIEMIERSRRTEDDDAKCVIATVALDASVVSEGPNVDSSANPIFIQLPGQVLQVLSDSAQWLPVSSEPYVTGRWRHDAPWYSSDDMFYLANKGAQALA